MELDQARDRPVAELFVEVKDGRILGIVLGAAPLDAKLDRLN